MLLQLVLVLVLVLRSRLGSFYARRGVEGEARPFLLGREAELVGVLLGIVAVGLLVEVVLMRVRGILVLVLVVAMAMALTAEHVMVGGGVRLVVELVIRRMRLGRLGLL